MDYWGSYYGTNMPSGGYGYGSSGYLRCSGMEAQKDVTSFSADGAYSTVFATEKVSVPD